MRRGSKVILLALVGLMFAVGCDRQTPSPLGFWADYDPQTAMEDIATAEKEFEEWTRRLHAAEESVQMAAIEEFAQMMGSDAVGYYIYTEWAMNHLYGVWSPVRNERLYGHLLRLVAADARLEGEDRSYIPRILELMQHNRIGEMPEEVRMLDTAGVEWSFEDFRGRRVLVLMVDVSCVSCVDTIKRIESQKAIVGAQREGRLELVVVAVGQTPETLEPLEREHAPKGWRVMCASRSDIESAYFDLEAVPFITLLGAGGEIEMAMTRDVEALAERLK